MSGSQLSFAVIALIGGAAVPFLASINASFGQQIGSIWLAALTLCLVAFLSILAVGLTQGVPTASTVLAGDWWHYSAGCFFAVYVVSITFVAPRIGLANAIILVVVAQIFTAVAIDHFGLLGQKVTPVDWKRALGVVFLVLGVALARSQPAPAGATG